MDNSYELAKLLRDNIYCISLKEKEENRKAILNLFPSAKFFDAIDTRGFNVLDYKDKVQEDSWEALKIANEKNIRNYHHSLTNGSVGCFLSHIEIVKHIVANKIPYSLVLEDDCIIRPQWNIDLPKFLDHILDDIPLDLDLYFLNLSSFFVETIGANTEDGLKIFNPPWGYYMDESKQWVRPDNKNFQFFQVHSVIISYEGAVKILQNFTKVKMQYDSFLANLFRKGKINIYINRDQIFIQNQLNKSSINTIEKVKNINFFEDFDLI
jgi:GR25 family glycosyltransferase involved in LPS biosynthesis